MERIVVDQRRLQIPSPSNRNGETSSQISDLAEYVLIAGATGLCTDLGYSCPVCGANLSDIGPTPLQEAHVKNCLEGGSGATPQAAKYLVYKLPAESALIGTECKRVALFVTISSLTASPRCYLPGRICQG